MYLELIIRYHNYFASLQISVACLGQGIYTIEFLLRGDENF